MKKASKQASKQEIKQEIKNKEYREKERDREKRRERVHSVQSLRIIVSRKAWAVTFPLSSFDILFPLLSRMSILPNRHQRALWVFRFPSLPFLNKTKLHRVPFKFQNPNSFSVCKIQFPPCACPFWAASSLAQAPRPRMLTQVKNPGPGL